VQKTKSRLPRCHRDCSRQLHPLHGGLTDLAESAFTLGWFSQTEPQTARKAKNFETAGLEDIQITPRTEIERQGGLISSVSQSDSASDSKVDLLPSPCMVIDQNQPLSPQTD
jgi:hypothetical protein